MREGKGKHNYSFSQSEILSWNMRQAENVNALAVASGAHLIINIFLTMIHERNLLFA